MPPITITDPLLMPATTLIGPGRVAALWEQAARFGQRGVLVHGASFSSQGRLTRLMTGVPTTLSVTIHQHSGGEPTLDQVESLRKVILARDAEWVAAIGGGSVIDLGKAAAGLARAMECADRYHEGCAVAVEPLPFLAAPTTAGTGAEATANAVLTNAKTGSKKSIRDPRWLAAVVILDPDLLAGTPPPVIGGSGMDALTQAVEAFISLHASWFSDAMAAKALALIAANLPRAFSGNDAAARLDLMIGSYLAGVALTHARLGVVHGIAHPLGVQFKAPHGLVCAVCLPHALALNRPYIGSKYDAMCDAVGGDMIVTASRLLDTLAIRSPFTGRTIPDRKRIVEETLASGSTRANPKPITPADVEWLLDQLFHTP